MYDFTERSDSSRNMQAPAPEPGSGAGAKRGSSGVRLLRGHKAAVTALHAGTRQEMGDCMGDYEDTGYFISGSADCTVCPHTIPFFVGCIEAYKILNSSAQ